MVHAYQIGGLSYGTVTKVAFMEILKHFEKFLHLFKILGDNVLPGNLQ